MTRPLYVDLDDIGEPAEHTSMVQIAPRPAPVRPVAEPQPLRPMTCLCVVRHGDDVCIVLAPKISDVHGIVRARRRMLRLQGEPEIETVRMVEVAS